MRTQIIEIPYSPRSQQRQLHTNLKRFNVLVCHRRFGKTVMAVNELIKQAITCERERPRYAYLAPQYKQAKAVAWDYVQQFTRPIPGMVYNQSELRADFPNGARIQLLGADSPDSLRGIYLDGVVLDEVAQMPPKVWSEVIRPALADRNGWAIFIGTPKGQNMFYDMYQLALTNPDWFAATYRASETGIIPEAELAAVRGEGMTDDEYEQEFECSFTAALTGAYYGKEMTAAEREGRITDVPYDPAHLVDTYWDLGIGDDTTIWFVQSIGQQHRVIDFYSTSGVGLPHYAGVLKSKPYVYGRHVAPHDIEVKELGSGLSRKETAANLGIRFDVAPMQSIDDGINAVRMTLPKCWFDRSKCGDGIKALTNYQREWNHKMGVFRSGPLHDWSSHAADAFRYFAVSYRPAQAYSLKQLYRM